MISKAWSTWPAAWPMMSGVHSRTVIVPRSGIVTLRSATGSAAVGPAVASVRRVLATAPRARSTVGGG